MFRPGEKAFVLDLSLSALLIYASVWVYELSNLLSLHVAGATPYLVVQGVLPLGVVAASPAPMGVLPKVLQVCFAGAVLLLPLRRLWSRPGLVTGATVLVIGSCLVSSFVWEAAGAWSASPPWEGPALFFLLTTVLAFATSGSLLRRSARVGTLRERTPGHP